MATDPSGASLLAWVQQYRGELSEGVQFNLDQHRYLRGIYEDTSRELVIMKSGQGGASEYCVSRALWSCDAREMNVLYLLPTIGDISDFSQMRIGMAIEASQYLAGIVAKETGKRSADRVQLKRIRDRWLVLRGAQVRAAASAAGGTPRAGASRLKSVPVDLVIYDEYDEMPFAVEALAVKRLGHSTHKEQAWVSTPTYPGAGIHRKFNESDQRHWEIPCGHCGTWQTLTIGHVVIEYDDLERPVAWHGQDDGRAWCACQSCGRELDRLAEGRWVAYNPGAAIRGYTFNKLVTAQNEPLAVVRALQTTDESKRQEAFNQDLALPYKPRGSGLDTDILNACIRDYGFGAGLAEQPVMGIDVGRVLHVVIRGPAHPETGERPLRWAGEVGEFEEASRLIERYKVQRCVVDAMPETRLARLFQQAHRPRLVWLAYYLDDSKAGEEAGWKEERGPGGWSGTVNLDRTRVLDDTVARFMEQVNTLPGNIRSLPRYYEQLLAPVRVMKTTPKGKVVARYVEAGPDHYAHAEAYCTAASLEAKPRAGAWGR
ncbi:MAG: phage terminase large subunit family protein [Caldilinea sp.]|nr:phage terminase large subunit family protein [Caldilinea sp.]